MKDLILTIGLPYSGKSTWARTQGHPVVNPDSIRLALHGERYIVEAEPYVWAIAMTMVKALFLAGHTTVIVDGTHNTIKRREFWQSDEWNIRYKCFYATASECMARAISEHDEVILPVIERMGAQHESIGLQKGARKWEM